MANPFDFDLKLTENFASALSPVNRALAETTRQMEATHAANLTLEDHLKIARGFQSFARNATQASIPLEQHAAIAQSLGNFFGGLGKSTERTAAALAAGAPPAKRFHVELGNLVQSFAGFRYEAERGVVFNLAEGLRTVGGVAGNVADIVSQIALKVAGTLRELGTEITKIAGRTQDLNLAIEFAAGGKDKADAVRELADGLADQTRFDDDLYKRGFLPFLEAQVRDVDLLDSIGTAAADAAARRGGTEEAFSAALGALQDIAIKRKASRGALEALVFQEDDFYAGLGKYLGTSEERAKKLAEEGKVNSDQLLKFTLQALADRNGGRLGTAARASAQTLGGSLQKLSDLGENFLKRLESSPGVKALQNVIDGFVNVISGPAGEELAGAVGDTFHAVVRGLFGDLSGPDGAQKLEAEVRNVRDLLREWLPILQSAAELVRDTVALLAKLPRFGRGLVSDTTPGGVTHAPVADAPGFTGGANLQFDIDDTRKLLARAGQSKALGFASPAQLEVLALKQFAIEQGVPAERVKGYGLELFGGDADKLRAIVAAHQQGQAVAQGLANGIAQGAPTVEAAVEQLASLPGDVTREVNKINSPSGLTRELGYRLPEGLALGIGDGAHLVAEAARRSLANAANDVGGGGARGARALHVDQVLLQVYVGAGAGPDAAQQGAVAGAAARVEFVRFLDEVQGTG